MAKPVLLQDSWHLGFKRDAGRDRLPKGAVWNILDFLPDLEAGLRKRGGWSYEGPLLTTLDASAGNLVRVFVAPFRGGTQVLAVDDRANPELFDVTNSVDRGSVYGAAAGAPPPCVFYNEHVLIPSHDIDSSPVNPRKYNSAGTLSDLAGAPGTRFFAIYKNRVAAAAADTDAPNRVYFSAAGQAESWDTTNRWLDTSGPPNGLASLRNSLIVFHQDSVERIRGDIPPGSAAANMVLEPLFDNVGLCGADALAVDGDHVVWADDAGVYMTDGASLSNLTEQGGIEKFWQDQVVVADSGATIAVGIWRGYVFISMLTSAKVFVDFLVCKLSTRAWFRFTNISAKNFATHTGGTKTEGDEFYFSNQSTKRVGDLSTVFTPAVGNKADANGDEPVPTIETPFYEPGGAGKKRWKYVYLTYDVREGASDDPSLGMSYTTSPETISYTALPGATPFTETTKQERKRQRFGLATRGAAFSIAQASQSADTRVYRLEADVHPLEGSRL